MFVMIQLIRGIALPSALALELGQEAIPQPPNGGHGMWVRVSPSLVVLVIELSRIVPVLPALRAEHRCLLVIATRLSRISFLRLASGYGSPLVGCLHDLPLCVWVGAITVP